MSEKHVNILGDSAREQWLNAINLCQFAIESNLSAAAGGGSVR